MSYTTDEIMDIDLMDSLSADWDLFEEADEDDTVYDYNADIPAVIQQAAQHICTEYEVVLTSIAHIADSNTYVAWYDNPTLHPEDDGHTLFREFRLADGIAIDTYK